jgi:glucosyl-3-phosphoglycerate phosphatase
VSTPRRVVIWRHGRTSWNVDGRFQGQLDIELDEVGVEQAARAARLLAGLPPTAVISSDLLRARGTVEPLLRLTRLEATYDPRLRETHGGGWQGRAGGEIFDAEAKLWEAWRSGADLPAGGSGERRSEVGARAAEAVRAALADLPAEGVLVAVTHGGTARALIGTMTGLPLEHWAIIGGLGNCAWSALEETRDGRWLLEEHNAGTLPAPVDADVL